MSFEAMAAAWGMPLPPHEKILLLAFADWHRTNQPNPFPGQELLARQTGLSTRTIIRLTAKLQQKGLIACERRHRVDGTRTSNRYTLAFLSATVSPGLSDNGDATKCHRVTTRDSKRDSKNINIREVEETLGSVLDGEHTQAVLSHRAQIKKPLTLESAKRLAKQFAKARNPNDAADEMILRGWVGFKPEWVKDRHKPDVDCDAFGRPYEVD